MTPVQDDKMALPDTKLQTGENGAQDPPLNILTDYHVLRILGRGCEGIVYLVEDKERLRKLVLKVFHKPYPRDWVPGLIIYADNIIANDNGLPVITLLQSSDKIVGVQYPYVQLHSLHWRILNLSEQVAQSAFGAYCRMQSYLISEYGLVLPDTPLCHFMVAKDGQWHYLDFGVKVRTMSDPMIPKYGLLGYGFAALLLSIYNKTLHHLMLPVEGYSYDEPCIYCMNEWLDAVAIQHSWVQEILSEVRSHKPSIFHDPEFYRHLSERLPSRVPLPSLVLSISKFLFWVRKLRHKLGFLGPVTG